MPTSTSHMLSLKKLSTIGIHFQCLKCYKRNFIVLPSVMWMQKSKLDGSNFGMAIGLTKMHYISQNLLSLILHLMIGYQSLHIRYSWKKNLLRSFIVFFSSSLQLPSNVPILFEYIQTWKFAAFNSIFYRKFKSGKVKKHNVWDEQPNIDFTMKRVLYMYNLIFTICLIFSLHVLNFHSIFGS